MAHPNPGRRLNPLKQSGIPLDLKLGKTVFASGGGVYLSTQEIGHQLKPVADPQHRDSQLDHKPVTVRRSLFVDRCGSPGKDYAFWVPSAYFVDCSIEGEDLAVDPQLSYSPGDELSVLTAEIENDDRFVFRGHEQI